jgi:hypothetical protein
MSVEQEGQGLTDDARQEISRQIDGKLDGLKAKVEGYSLGDPKFLALSDIAQELNIKSLRFYVNAYPEYHTGEELAFESVRLSIIEETIRQREDTIPGYFAARDSLYEYLYKNLEPLYGRLFNKENERTEERSAFIDLNLGHSLRTIRDKKVAGRQLNNLLRFTLR